MYYIMSICIYILQIYIFKAGKLERFIYLFNINLYMNGCFENKC